MINIGNTLEAHARELDRLYKEGEHLANRVTNHEWDIKELRAERRGSREGCCSGLDIAVVFIIGAFFGASIIAGIDLYFWGLR